MIIDNDSIRLVPARREYASHAVRRRSAARVPDPRTQQRHTADRLDTGAEWRVLALTQANHRSRLSDSVKIPEAEYVYPNERSRGHVSSRVQPYSAVFTAFASFVCTRALDTLPSAVCPEVGVFAA